ncbi:hypothetical protein RJ640_005437 [Escallonia rubra]|uniref:Uncharacterized protein n=1 Tax=Escallonia rubra TaxID=112253 RepID=A0AA88QHB2_9ASTE|nr:hypothetical protein RJ640_005437 [Escallonia rubra]
MGAQRPGPSSFRLDSVALACSNGASAKGSGMGNRIGKVEIQRNMFGGMESRDVVSSNTMITGYVVCECHEEVLVLLCEMQRAEENNKNNDEEIASHKPNTITLMMTLPGCAALAALENGKDPCICR